MQARLDVYGYSAAQHYSRDYDAAVLPHAGDAVEVIPDGLTLAVRRVLVKHDGTVEVALAPIIVDPNVDWEYPDYAEEWMSAQAGDLEAMLRNAGWIAS